jgi:hypothetical protein
LHWAAVREEYKGKPETRMESKEEIQVAYDAIICKEAEEKLEELEAQVECFSEEGETQRS